MPYKGRFKAGAIIDFPDSCFCSLRDRELSVWGDKLSHLSLSGGLGPLHREKRWRFYLRLSLLILLFTVHPPSPPVLGSEMTQNTNKGLALAREQNCVCDVYKMFHCIVRSTESWCIASYKYQDPWQGWWWAALQAWFTHLKVMTFVMIWCKYCTQIRKSVSLFILKQHW